MLDKLEVSQLRSPTFRWPGLDSFLGQLVDPLQKFLLAFDQNGPRTLPAPILAGQPAELGALLGWHTVNTVLALFTASNHPPFVQIASGTPAVGFAAFAAKARSDRGGKVGSGSYRHI
jgi:hypothetical protein